MKLSEFISRAVNRNDDDVLFALVIDRDGIVWWRGEAISWEQCEKIEADLDNVKTSLILCRPTSGHA